MYKFAFAQLLLKSSDQSNDKKERFGHFEIRSIILRCDRNRI